MGLKEGYVLVNERDPWARRNRTKVGLKGARLVREFDVVDGRNRTKVGLKDASRDLLALSHTSGRNRTKVGLKARV